MAIEVKHATQATGTDAGNGEIAKAEWNEAHAINMATDRLLGRTTASAGPVEEITVGGGLSLASGTLSAEVTLAGAQTLTNKTAAKLVLNDGYTEEVFAITDGGTVNLDPNNGSIQTWTLGANRTPGQANWAAGQSITLMIDDGAAYSITWSTLAPVWKTDGGTAPALTPSGFTAVALWKVGSTIYGARVGDA